MSGAIIIVLVILFGLVPAMLVVGGIISALLGWTLKSNAEAEHEGSELVDLNY